MRKRRPSDELLAKNRRNRWANSFLRRKRRYKKNPTPWARLAKIRRLFSPGRRDIFFPEELDIFEKPSEWFYVFRSLCDPDANLIRLRMEALKFSYPEAIVYLASTVNHLLSRTNAIVREHKPMSILTDEYLRECGLRDFFYVKRNDPRTVDPKFFGDCIPISRDSQDKVSLAEKLAKLIATRLSLDLNKKTLLSESLGEIMGNALDHSEVAHWYRIGQVHPTRRKITIAIADNGVGVPHTLKDGYLGSSMRKLKDAQILQASFHSDVTRFAPKVGEAHGGGLATVMEFARETNSKLAMLSGKGLFQVDFKLDPTDGAPQLTTLPGDLPGTLLVLRIPY